MEKRFFSNWLREYIDYTQHSEAPDVLHFWTGISVIAGALRRRVWIEQRYFQWTPNFYIFFVGPPGIVSKSTTAAVGMRLLKEIEGVNFGPESITWQSLTKSLAEATELILMPDGLMHPMSCLTIVASELGTFFNPQDREMVDVLVSLWDGQKGVWRRTTKTQGADTIENPWLNIIGCTTPSWLSINFPEYMVGGGFTSRSVFIYADKKRQFVAYPGLHIDDKSFQATTDKLVHDLLIISNLAGEYKLDKDAIEWGTTWYKAHWSHRPSHMSSERYGGYIARKQTHIHKLAMVLAAAQRNELIITQNDLETSAEIVTSIEADMINIFSQIGSKEESLHTRELLTLIRHEREMPRRKLWRIVMHLYRDVSEFEAGLVSLLEAGYITQISRTDGLYLRINDESKAT